MAVVAGAAACLRPLFGRVCVHLGNRERESEAVQKEKQFRESRTAGPLEPGCTRDNHRVGPRAADQPEKTSPQLNAITASAPAPTSRVQ